MTALGLKIFDEAVQDANRWVNEVAERAGGLDKRHAYRILRAVLHVLRDNLPPNEAAHLGAQLPTLVRGIYYEAWAPAKTPRKLRHRDEFIAEVQRVYGAEPIEEPERAIAAVLDTLDAHVSPGEMEDVRGALTRDVRALFAW